MIRVRFVQPRTTEWAGWKKRCNDRLRPYLLGGRGRPPIDEDLYKECSDLILQGYAGKCAYCEGKLNVQTRLDVEHFRPKSAVRDLHNKIVYARGRKRHNGYWWLAYDPRNLLPSCPMCNRYTKKAGGKGERFPVAGFRATRPGEEKKEKALLIHPGREDPRRHIKLDLDSGKVIGLTEKGIASIEVFGLDREGLIEARRVAIQDATMFLCSNSPKPDQRRRIREQLDGLLSYSFVWRAVKAGTKRPRRRRKRR
jgi:hypothetical protein